MKQRLKYLTLTILVIIPILTYAQISEGGTPPSFQAMNKLRASEIIPVHSVPIDIDVKRLIWEDSIAEKNHSAVRVAEVFPVNVNIDSTGIWTNLSNGQKIWRQTVTAPDAEGLIISYKDFYIPEGGKLFIYNADKSQVLGAYTHSTNKDGGRFVTEIVHGDTFTIEYVASTISKEQPRIELLDIGYVYDKSTLLRAASDGNVNYNPNNDDIKCIPNINCYPENNKWRDQKRGIVLMLLKKMSDVRPPGSWLGCSGSLINNAKEPGIPYVLTASHCLIGNNLTATEGSYEASVFYFNYEDASCTSSGVQPSLSQTIVGSTIKSFVPLNKGSDAALLLLSSAIPSSYGVYFNGWDRQGTIPKDGAIIHHPNRDVKRITKYASTPTRPAVSTTTLNMSGVTGIPIGHFSVRYSEGVTQSGSSGSPMFNDKGLIVGTLSAGASRCDNPTAEDVYGRFFFHWDKYVSDEVSPKQSRTLKEFLDPDGTGITTLSGYDPNGTSGIDNIVDNTVDFVLFPNPADNEVHINCKSIIKSMRIYNISGRLLYSRSDNNSSTLSVNIKGWSSGVYNVVVQTVSGKISDKFIKK